MNDKEQLIAIDRNRLNKYLTAWMDEVYREKTEVGKCESAYIALYQPEVLRDLQAIASSFKIYLLGIYLQMHVNLL